MKITEYLKDKVIYILICFALVLGIGVILFVVNTNYLITIYILLLLMLSFILISLLDYIKRSRYYNKLIKSINNLDKSYLITEIIEEPDFLEGKIFYNCLYEINKSMHENVNIYKNISEEFKNYIELWCHEIKIPITTSKIIIENNKNKLTNNINEEINKIAYFVEQVLFYARSENVEKDYIVKEVSLKSIIEEIIRDNKKILIGKKIKIECINLDIVVNSDSKWLKFIIDQIIINSIKYSKEEDSVIKIYTDINKNNIELVVEDNGIGIIKGEISRVFDKGFTGSNGRIRANSTGMGLYLCKKMCDKLGHDIKIYSIKDKGTKLTLVFPVSSYTKL